MADVRPGAKMLLDAATTINERGKAYGSPTMNHQRIADIWNAIIKEKLKDATTLTAAEVAMMMVGLKLARLIETPNHVDSHQDIAGYAAVIHEITCG